MNPYTKFDSERAKYTERISDLQEELTLAESELQELHRERDAILRDVLGSGDIEGLDLQIESVKRQIGRLRERIQFAEDGMIQQLAGMLDQVEENRRKAVAKKEAEYEEAIRTLNRKKLEYLSDAARIGEIASEIDTINSKSNDCRRAAGKDPSKHWPFQARVSFHANPAVNGFDAASWETLCIPEWMIRPALLNNVLPKWSEELMNNGKGK